MQEQIAKLEARIAKLEADERDQEQLIDQLKRVTQMQTEAIRSIGAESARQALSALAGIFGGLAHQLQHAAQEAGERVKSVGRMTYEETSEINELTVVVSRVGNQINFAMADQPENIQNAGMEAMAEEMLKAGFLQDGEQKFVKLIQEVPTNDAASPAA